MLVPGAESVLAELWSPIAALTAADGRRAGGLITSTAVTTSLLPEAPRVAVILGRSQQTHELVLASSAFAVHLLPAEPLERSLAIFKAFGFHSGREGDKLAQVPWHPGVTGAPVIDEALAYAEARVVATLDADDVTVVVGEVVAGERLRAGPHLTIDAVRGHLTSADWSAWEARRAEEIAAARSLRATRGSEYIPCT